MEIKIGTVGKILTGDEAGSFVQVLDDKESTGGFLILTANNSKMEGGFDNWVENEDTLKQFFIESGWTICWLKERN